MGHNAQMDYLIRFVHMHESFRQPETDALAELAGLKIEWLFYSEDVRTLRKAKGSGESRGTSTLERDCMYRQ